MKLIFNKTSFKLKISELIAGESREQIWLELMIGDQSALEGRGSCWSSCKGFYSFPTPASQCERHII